MTGRHTLLALAVAGCFVSVPPLADEGSGGAAGSGGDQCTPGVFLECYEGPDGTQGVGECSAGTAECLPDGRIGACTNQVLPSLERCTTTPEPYDEDCNGGVNEHCAAWAQKYGANGAQGIEALSITAAGDVVIAGRNNGTVNLGGSNIVSSGGTSRAFVARLDPARARCAAGHCWSVGLAGTGRSQVDAVSESTSGDVLLAGSCSNRLDIGSEQEFCGGSTLAMYAAKLRSDDGVAQWISSFGTTAEDEQLHDIVPRPNGGAVAVGYTTGSIEFIQNQPIVAAAQDALVLALEPIDGAVAWARGFGGPGDDVATAVATDADGTLYVTGRFAQAIDFGCSSGPLASAGDEDVFVAKLTADGGCVWSVALGGPEAQRGKALARTGDQLLVGVLFAGTIHDPDGNVLASADDHDVLIARLDVADGRLAAHHAFSGGGRQELWDLAVGPGGIIAAALSLRGSIDFGGGVLVVPDYDVDIDDAAVLVLEPDGGHRFSRSFGGLRGDDDAFRAAFDASGRLWAAGEFDGSLDVGTGVMFSTGVDAFLLRIDDP